MDNTDKTCLAAAAGMLGAGLFPLGALPALVPMVRWLFRSGGRPRPAPRPVSAQVPCPPARPQPRPEPTLRERAAALKWEMAEKEALVDALLDDPVERMMAKAALRKHYRQRIGNLLRG